jgi:hypothetical protein
VARQTNLMNTLLSEAPAHTPNISADRGFANLILFVLRLTTPSDNGMLKVRSSRNRQSERGGQPAFGSAVSIAILSTLRDTPINICDFM